MDNAARCPQPHSPSDRMTKSSNRKERETGRAVRLRAAWIAAYREFGDAGAVCRRFGISRPTLRKWLRRHDADGNAGLEAQSRRPQTSPARKIGAAEEALILDLRRDRRLGVKRLRHELHRLHGLQVAPSTVHKVLVRHGINILPARKRREQKPKRYSRPVPGDRVQLDTCKIRPGLYQFTAIDDCSRYLVAGLARRPSAAATLSFLDQVLDEMPFAIQRVQTDRGAEFFAEEVQHRLMAEAIKFRPIPPRSPHLNGKVERVQRTVLEEFWGSEDARASDLGDRLSAWVHHYNWDRPHEALGGDCPIDRVCQRADKTPLWDAVSDAFDATKERVQVREFAVEKSLRILK